MKDQTATIQFDGFTLDQKAFVELQDGDLLIEGTAALWTPDLEDEAFEPGALDRGLKAYMERNPVVLFHHQTGRALGQTVEWEREDNRIRVKARIDKPAAGSWAEDVVNKIRRGTIRGLSLAGKFRRHLTKNGWRIYDADIREMSVSPFPLHAETTFAVVGAKAFIDPDDELEDDPISPEDAKALDALDDSLSSLENTLARARERFTLTATE